MNVEATVPQLMVGFDIGGTFTDVVLYDGNSRSYIHHKLPSTPDDPSRAAVDGVRQALELAGTTARDLTSLRHGTTVATNAVIEGRYSRTGLITTEGFRDILELARQVRPHLYHLGHPKPDPIVPRRRRLEVKERVTANGSVLVPLDEGHLAAQMDVLKEEHVEAVAVCLLHAYASGEHEAKIAQAIRTYLPAVHVCTSTEVVNEFREYERFCSTVVNASLLPLIANYVERLVSEAMLMGAGVPLQIMQSNGGLMSPSGAARHPIRTFLSGPAAGVVGAAATARGDGRHDLITFDMGGTSTDVCLIQAARLTVRREQRIAGLPVRTPTVDINTVGAGGGSIAWLDEGGLLKVGPRSAGAVPGPACYGRGGTEPTLTDANVVLGRLGAGALLGGRMSVDPPAALTAVATHVAKPLGLSAEDAAAGIVRIAVSNVVQAIRAVSVERGHDPRDFTLVAFGGAGPMHAVDVAMELGIGTVLIPSHPGLVCASGLLTAGIRHEVSRTRLMLLNDAAPSSLAELFAELDGELNAWRREEGLRARDLSLVSIADLRYAGQDFELEIEFEFGRNTDRITATTVRDLCNSFHASYQRTYGYSKPKRPVELVTGRLIASVPGADLAPVQPKQFGDVAVLSRHVWFLESGFAQTPVYLRDHLTPGQKVHGPSIIEDMDATTVLKAGSRAVVNPSGSLRIEFESARK